MSYAIARLFIAITLMAGALFGQASVCDLFEDLKAADGRQLTLSGDLIVSSSRTIAALGEADCDNRYVSDHLVWPTALALLPAAALPPDQAKLFRAAAVEADRLRRLGKTVNASASLTGRLHVAESGDLPAEFTFDAVNSLKVEALPDASELPVISICDLFQNLASWKGRRIALRGESVGTFEGSWLVGHCVGDFVTNGYRWPVSLSFAGPAYYSGSIAPLVEARHPSSPPKGAALFRGRLSINDNATYVGRLRMRDSYIAVCREGGDYITNGFGHLNGAAAELIVEEIRDQELTHAVSREEPNDDTGCHPPDIESRCPTVTPLARASLLGCTSRVAELLSKDGIDSKDGNASEALSGAIVTGDLAIVKQLLDAGAPVNPLKFKLWLPLGEAAWRGRIDVMKMLLDAGAKVDGTDAKGDTYLASYGYFNTRVLKLLLDAGADPNFRDSKGQTAIMRASQAGYEEAVVLLIERGASVDLKDPAGRSALMHAAEGKYVDAIPLLLQHGADVRAKDLAGKTALDIARESKNEVAIELLSAAMQ